MTVLEYINRFPLMLDGGMGTLLQARGLQPGELPELWNLSHPEVVQRIHRDYFEAGSNIVCANTFGVNAIKYSDSADPVEVSVRAEAGFARFEVRDHGKGLDQDAMANLFTATTIRSHAGGNGLGIGLSICRTIVEAHGGVISGRNEPDGGASFCFTLPLEELS